MEMARKKRDPKKVALAQAILDVNANVKVTKNVNQKITKNAD